MADAPKVFISHASEDKAEYAQPLAEALLAQGVDAWLDKWEMRPGDSLVERIFEEGLAQAGTCAFLMSKNSVDKPWVRAELENAVAKRIDKEIRLIPVKLEDCDVPNSVNSILWIDLARAGSVEKVADEIAKVVHGHSDKPELGPKPLYLNTSSIRLPSLDKQDEVVLGIAFEVALEKDSRRYLQGPAMFPKAQAKGIGEDAVAESVDMLIEHGYLEKKSKTLGGRHILVDMYLSTFLSIVETVGLPLEECRLAIAGMVINEGVTDIETVFKRATEFPKALVEAVLEDLNVRGFASVGWTIGNGGSVHHPTTAYKRWFREASA